MYDIERYSESEQETEGDVGDDCILFFYFIYIINNIILLFYYRRRGLRVHSGRPYPTILQQLYYYHY